MVPWLSVASAGSDLCLASSYSQLQVIGVPVFKRETDRPGPDGDTGGLLLAATRKSIVRGGTIC